MRSSKVNRPCLLRTQPSSLAPHRRGTARLGHRRTRRWLLPSKKQITNHRAGRAHRERRCVSSVCSVCSVVWRLKTDPNHWSYAMSTISAEAVMKLRQKTNAPMMDCKAALTEAAGDMEKAVDILRKK